MDTLLKRLQRGFARETQESGQTMAEYAVTMTVITIGIVTVIAALSTSISSSIANTISHF